MESRKMRDKSMKPKANSMRKINKIISLYQDWWGKKGKGTD